MLAYQAARAVWPELAILDPIVGGVTLLLVAHQAVREMARPMLSVDRGLKPHGAPIHKAFVQKGRKSMFYQHFCMTGQLHVSMLLEMAT